MSSRLRAWWIYQSWNPDKPLDREMVMGAVNALTGASVRQLVEQQ
jgi:hypothetical protein